MNYLTVTILIDFFDEDKTSAIRRILMVKIFRNIKT